MSNEDKKHTGLALSEVKGLLSTLINNLSGEQGKYWITALKKFLRKEEIPEPPTEVQRILTATTSRTVAKRKIEELIECLKTLPVVEGVTLCDSDEEGDILNINIFPNLITFIHGNNGGLDTAIFSIRKNHTVQKMHRDTDNIETDEIFTQWCKDEYPDITTFYQVLLELGKKYEESVPALQ